jgi:LmbE family N-acetylglucosaminyl deacetylase
MNPPAPGPAGGSRFELPVGQLPEAGSPSTELPRPDVALAIAAHPDDAEFACGATLARWAEAGCAVFELVLTDGQKGTWEPDSDPAALAAARRVEQQQAASLLGVASVDFLGLTDGELQSGLAERRLVCAAIRRIRPDVVLGHDPWRRYRLHPDHRHAGWLTVDGVVAARDPAFFPDLGLPPHRPRTLLLFEPDQPNHVEPASPEHLDRKVRALLAHQSQLRSTMGIDPAATPEEVEAARAAFRDAVVRQAAHHGALAGLSAGEAFHRIEPL